MFFQKVFWLFVIGETHIHIQIIGVLLANGSICLLNLSFSPDAVVGRSGYFLLCCKVVSG